jgi:thymidylate synthase ThyX
MIDAKIVLDSVGPNDARLTTYELTYPRMVHAELMTHRVFSRNAASSRAIPTEKLLARIETDPAMPVYWGKNQAGMQAREELRGDELTPVVRGWLSLMQRAVDGARSLASLGLHKQIANRVVEPWMDITVIVTATEYGNFFALRDHADAQPELAACAAKAHALYRESEPQRLEAGQWHLPYVTGNDDAQLVRDGFVRDMWAVSVGRCARVSYLTHDQRRDPAADVALAKDRIQPSGHMSPFEHPAQAMTTPEWERYAEEAAQSWIRHRVPVGNFWGWKQLRKTLPHEHDFGELQAQRGGA